MSLSKVEITFNSIPNLNDGLVINNDLLGTPLGNISEIFQTLRQQPIETTIGTTIATSAGFYLTAIELDYNSTNLYTINQFTDDTITIEAEQDGVTFTETFNDTSGRITVVITNVPAIPTLTIDDITFSEADSNPCGTVKVEVTTSELATEITSPVEVDPNNDNPFEFDWVRAVTVNIACETATLSVSEDVQLPAILSVGNTTITVVNTPTGSTATVTHVSTYLLELEYSLDDITYQSGVNANIFTGLAVGDYTMYIKDQLGCEISTGFSVSIFTPDISVTVPDFLVSKSMSIRYKRDTVWGNCSDYKNEENTLSCEYPSLLQYPTIQKFQTCDPIPTQFRTNYGTLAANVIKSDGTKDALTISKVTDFLDKKDKRDSTYYNINDTQTGIYFTTGNTYDYVTGIANGTYALNGLLPEWGIIGNYVFFDSGWRTIVGIITDEDLNADVLVIDYVYAGAPAAAIVSSNYNLFNYDFYEFNTDMSGYENQVIQVEILATDDTFTAIRELSEQIEVEERWADTMEVLYWNPSNTDVYYASGIQNKIRVEYQTFHPGNDGDIEGLDTDTNSILLNSQLYETNTLVLFPVTVAISRQITQAFVHKELYLNGVKYRIMELPEPEPFGQTNLVIITATFKRSDNVFNSQLDGSATEVESTGEVTGLITSGGKYIKLSS